MGFPSSSSHSPKASCTAGAAWVSLMTEAGPAAVQVAESGCTVQVEALTTKILEQLGIGVRARMRVRENWHRERNHS